MREYNGILNISEPDNDYYVYKIYSSDFTDNSIYIGVTKNYKQRCYKHSVDRKRKKYSDKPLYIWINQIIDEQERNVIFEVIEKELSEEDAFNMEIVYIKKYKDLNYNVLNISEGGKGKTGCIPWNKGKSGHLTTKQLFSLSRSHTGQISPMLGKQHSIETKKLISIKNKERKNSGWVSPKRKTVYKYDNNNVLLASYSSLIEAGLKEGSSPTSIGEWCRKDKQPRNEFFWSYDKLN